MVFKHVRTVAKLMIVQGILDSVFGLALGVSAPFIPDLVRNLPEKQRGDLKGDAEELRMVPKLWPIYGIIHLVIGGLAITAGLKNLQYRGRIFGLLALLAGLGTFPPFCLCFLTSLALLIYGRMVYQSPDVVRAFELGEKGATLEEIKAGLEKWEREGDEADRGEPSDDEG
jgi:hypothetical protein